MNDDCEICEVSKVAEGSFAARSSTLLHHQTEMWSNPDVAGIAFRLAMCFCRLTDNE